MGSGLLHEHFGAAGPDHDEAIAAVPLLEGTDVGDHLLGQVALARARLDVGTIQPLDVPLVEDRRHRADGLQFAANLVELHGLEHAGRSSRRVAVLLEDVPSAEDEIAEVGERHEIANQGRPRLRALAETDSAYLRQRPDRQRETLADRQHACDRGRADGAEADQQHTEFARRRGDREW